MHHHLLGDAELYGTLTMNMKRGKAMNEWKGSPCERRSVSCFESFNRSKLCTGTKQANRDEQESRICNDRVRCNVEEDEVDKSRQNS